jgi:hypothetical protein
MCCIRSFQIWNNCAQIIWSHFSVRVTRIRSQQVYLIWLWLPSILMMSPSLPATQVGPAAIELPSGQPPSSNQLLPSSQPCRPLHREGAFRIELLTPSEQALEDAMNRPSSPPPQSVLGKRTHDGDGADNDDIDTEPDKDAPSRESQPPSISNVIATSLRYASKKKLCPEQRGEVEVFLSVSHRSIVIVVISKH